MGKSPVFPLPIIIKLQSRSDNDHINHINSTANFIAFRSRHRSGSVASHKSQSWLTPIMYVEILFLGAVVSTRRRRIFTREPETLTNCYFIQQNAEEAAEIKKRRAFRKFSYRGVDLDQYVEPFILGTFRNATRAHLERSSKSLTKIPLTTDSSIFHPQTFAHSSTPVLAVDSTAVSSAALFSSSRSSAKPSRLPDQTKSLTSSRLIYET